MGNDNDNGDDKRPHLKVIPGGAKTPPIEGLSAVRSEREELFETVMQSLRKFERENGNSPTLRQLANIHHMPLHRMASLLDEFLPPDNDEGNTRFSTSLRQLLLKEWRQAQLVHKATGEDIIQIFSHNKDKDE